MLGHATYRVRPDSAHFAACRAAWLYAPYSPNIAHLPPMAPLPCSKLALISRSPTHCPCLDQPLRVGRELISWQEVIGHLHSRTLLADELWANGDLAVLA